MLRTNIYLEERQSAMLDRLAAEEGVSRAALIRRFLDERLEGIDDTLESDLSAIDASFGVLEDDFEDVTRGRDARAERLDRLWQIDR